MAPQWPDDLSPAYRNSKLATDVCICGHLREQHLAWGSGETCSGTFRDDTECECSGFEKDAGGVE